MKQLVKQSALRFAGLYTATIVVYSFCMFRADARVQSYQYLLLFGMFCVLWLITFLRALLDRFQWGLRQHYFLKRILFVPLYLAVTLFTLLNFGYPFENSPDDVLFITVIFALGFIFSLFPTLYAAKRQEKQFDRLLHNYQDHLPMDKK